MAVRRDRAAYPDVQTLEGKLTVAALIPMAIYFDRLRYCEPASARQSRGRKRRPRRLWIAAPQRRLAITIRVGANSPWHHCVPYATGRLRLRRSGKWTGKQELRLAVMTMRDRAFFCCRRHSQRLMQGRSGCLEWVGRQAFQQTADRRLASLRLPTRNGPSRPVPHRTTLLRRSVLRGRWHHC